MRCLDTASSGVQEAIPERVLRPADESRLLATTHGAGSGVVVPSPSGEG